MTKTAILAFKNENDLKPINDVIDQAFLRRWTRLAISRGRRCPLKWCARMLRRLAPTG